MELKDGFVIYKEGNHELGFDGFGPESKETGTWFQANRDRTTRTFTFLGHWRNGD